jgi:hypothetical protein
LCHRIAAQDNHHFQHSQSVEVSPIDGSSSISGVDFTVVSEKTSAKQKQHQVLMSPLHKIDTNITTNGGVVFFLHIPKTGGTTLRLNLERYERIRYIFAKNYSVYWETAPLVEDAIVHGTANNTVLFYEIHATTAPSFFRLRHRLRRWKDTAERNGVPTFFLTLLRDSTAYAFSHFNFFHIQRRNPTFEQCNATLDNFLRLTLYNPQCQFLFQGEASMRAQKPKNRVLTKQDCDAVQEHLMELMDWIGATEHLSNETLPLLSRLLNLPYNHTWTNHKVSRDAQDVYFGMDNVTEAVLDWIQHDMSFMDREMYSKARDRYRYDSLWATES